MIIVIDVVDGYDGGVDGSSEVCEREVLAPVISPPFFVVGGLFPAVHCIARGSRLSSMMP